VNANTGNIHRLRVNANTGSIHRLRVYAHTGSIQTEGICSYREHTQTEGICLYREHTQTEGVGSEVFTVVTMKNSVLWDVAPCGFIINRRFGGVFRLHLQGRTLFLARVISSTLNMEAARSSETSVYNTPTRCHIPEDDTVL
jgi:hypothetical protein